MAPWNANLNSTFVLIQFNEKIVYLITQRFNIQEPFYIPIDGLQMLISGKQKKISHFVPALDFYTLKNSGTCLRLLFTYAFLLFWYVFDKKECYIKLSFENKNSFSNSSSWNKIAWVPS